METIRRGFDDYIVIGSVGGDHVAGHAPETARTTLFGGGGGTLSSDDAPLLAHHRVLTVRMFQAGVGDSAATVSARAVLGDEWEAVVAKGPSNTCLGVGGLTGVAESRPLPARAPRVRRIVSDAASESSR